MTVAAPPPAPPALAAPPVAKAPAIDGAVDEWPWQEEARVVAIARTPDGQAAPAAARACAARDAEFLYLAVRVVVAPGSTLRGGTDFRTSDGVEFSLRASGTGSAAHVLWGSCDGAWLPLPAGGTTPEQRAAMQQAVRYATRAAKEEWTCEWQVPLRDLAADPDGGIPANIGLHVAASDAWLAWVATGGPFYDVQSAGRLAPGR